MPSSSSFAGGNINVLGKFTDALYIGIRGKTNDSAIEKLCARKKEAPFNQTGEGVGTLEIAGLPGGPLRLRFYGRGKYEHVMENEACYIEVTAWAHLWTNLPSLRIQFKSRVLYEKDLDELERIVDDVLANHFMEPGFEVLVSRFDLAVDFQVEGLELPAREDVITRSKKWKVEGDGPQPNTVTFGKFGELLQVQIYEKTEEIKSSGKTWMFDVWQEGGQYTEGLGVWRVECRFFRDKLRVYGVNTIADLQLAMGKLVRLVFGDEDSNSWIRVAVPETRGRRQDRRKAAPWWEEVKAAFLEGMPVTTSDLLSTVDPGPDVERDKLNFRAYFERVVVHMVAENNLDLEDISLEEFSRQLLVEELRRGPRREGDDSSGCPKSQKAEDEDLIRYLVCLIVGIACLIMEPRRDAITLMYYEGGKSPP